MAAHAKAMLDAFIHAFALFEASLPSMGESDFVVVVEDITQTLDRILSAVGALAANDDGL